MSRYIAFDVETPNRANNRISAIGITITDGQRIIDEYYSLVDPKTHFDRFNTILTGISSKSTIALKITVSAGRAKPSIYAPFRQAESCCRASATS